MISRVALCERFMVCDGDYSRAVAGSTEKLGKSKARQLVRENGWSEMEKNGRPIWDDRTFEACLHSRFGWETGGGPNLFKI